MVRARAPSIDALSAGRRLIRRWSAKWKVHRLAEQVTCEWSSRLTRSLGRAYPGRMLVRLSVLLQRSPYSPLFEEVLCHEVAHLAVHALHGSQASPHGPEWKRLLRLAGYEPRRALFVDNGGDHRIVRLAYEHTCPVCQATRVARHPHRSWRCAACRRAGLEGNLIIRNVRVKPEVRDA
jgi:predicted SprT family Zn-dependent metalloprotease